MINPTLLIIIGTFIVGFGFWWKLRIYWFYKSSAYLEEIVLSIEEKLAENQELTPHEKSALRDMKSGPWMWRVCSRLGVAVIAIGFIILMIK